MSNEQKRDPSPELAEAEQSLRRVAALNAADFNYPERRDIGYAQAIAAELVRLRAEVARHESAAFRTLYVPAENAADALNAVVGHGFKATSEAAARAYLPPEHDVFVVELRVRP
jgi:hypothetical protein